MYILNCIEIDCNNLTYITERSCFIFTCVVKLFKSQSVNNSTSKIT